MDSTSLGNHLLSIKVIQQFQRWMDEIHWTPDDLIKYDGVMLSDVVCQISTSLHSSNIQQSEQNDACLIEWQQLQPRLHAHRDASPSQQLNLQGISARRMCLPNSGNVNEIFMLQAVRGCAYPVSFSALFLPTSMILVRRAPCSFSTGKSVF